MTKIGLVSLGCPKNQVDAEVMLAKIAPRYKIVSDPYSADIVIINTCGFIESAKQEAIDTILEFTDLKEQGEIKGVIVTGCLAQRYAKEIMEDIPEVDGVVGLTHNGEINSIIDKISGGEKYGCAETFEKFMIEGERRMLNAPHFAYLKIAEGCDNRCTYCAIPLIRGRFNSRSMESVIAEAKTLAETGVKEIILVAQDTTKYGVDLYGELKLADLLQEISKIEGIQWIRMLYCYPESIDDKLISVIKNNPKVVKYIDMPIQHVSAEIVRRMNRRLTGEQIMELIGKLRSEIPEIQLRTTMLVGFPGETEEHFEELMAFVTKARFEKLGCFAYSPEEGTPAAKFEDQIDLEVKERRAELIMQEQILLAEELNRANIGKTVEMIIEGYEESIGYIGRTIWDAPEIDFTIFAKGKEGLKNGEIVRAKITDTEEFDLIGEIID